jgi:hypothetical protein
MAPSAIEFPTASPTDESYTAYKSTPKLKAALQKAEADFRSDVVTIPTEKMIQVSSHTQAKHVLELS